MGFDALMAKKKVVKKKFDLYRGGFLASFICLVVFVLMLIFIPQNDGVWYLMVFRLIGEYGTGFAGATLVGFVVTTLISSRLRKRFMKMMGGV